MSLYKGHRLPPDIISYSVWLFYRLNLIHRDIEDLLSACRRGLRYQLRSSSFQNLVPCRVTWAANPFSVN